jgi:hypothetical protein
MEEEAWGGGVSAPAARCDGTTILPCQIGKQGSVLWCKFFTLLRFPSRLFKGGFGKGGATIG